jgi:hypothetical protein
MKSRSAIIALIAGLMLIGATALILHQIDQHRRLGQPGLAMTEEVVFDETGRIVNTNTVALPVQVLDYDSTNAPISLVELKYLPADTTYARKIYFRTNSYPIQTSVVMMGMDRSSIHKPQYCLVGQGWQVLSEGEDVITLSGEPARQLPVWKMIAQQPRERADGSRIMVKAVYYYWFVADGYVTARHEQRMWWMARELLRSGTLQRWAYVSVLAQCLPEHEDATSEQVKEFIAAAAPAFHKSDTIMRVADVQSSASHQP